MHAHPALAVSREDVMKNVIAVAIAIVLAFVLAFVVGYIPGLTDVNWFGIGVTAALITFVANPIRPFDYLLAGIAAFALLLPMFTSVPLPDSGIIFAWGIICGVIAAQIAEFLFVRRYATSHR